MQLQTFVWVGGNSSGAEGCLVSWSMLRLHNWRVLCYVRLFHFIFGFLISKKKNLHQKQAYCDVTVGCIFVYHGLHQMHWFKRALYNAWNSTDVFMQRGKIKTKLKCLRAFFVNHVSSSSEAVSTQNYVTWNERPTNSKGLGMEL